MTPVLVLNGPNLRRLGVREPDKYGTTSYDDLAALCRDTGRRLNLNVDFRQTDDEAEMLRWVHEAADLRIPVVLNPAAFTHYSYALRDALAQRTAPSSRCTSPTRPPARSSATPPSSPAWPPAPSPASAPCPTSWPSKP